MVVVELSDDAIASPVAARTLADHGATVVKVVGPRRPRAQAQAAACQQGLTAVGGQLVARMQMLQRDVAARCEQVQQSARDEARRSSGVHVAGAGGGGLCLQL